MIYIFVGIILLYGLKFDKLDWRTKEKRIWWHIELLAVIFLAGLRFRVGGDTLQYYDNYLNDPTFGEVLKHGLFEYKYGPLWYAIESLCKIFTNDFVLFQLVHALFVNIVIFRFIKKYCKRPFLFVIFYYYMIYLIFNMEIMRQGLSISFFLLSIPFLLQKKFIKYYILTLIAFGFHTSSFILFFLPLFYGILSKKTKFKSFLIIFIVLIIVSFTPFIQNVIKITGIVSMMDRLDNYNENLSNVNGMIRYTVDFLVIVFFVIKCPQKRKEDIFLINIYLLMFAITIPFIYFTRIVDFFEIPFYIIFFNTLDCYIFKKKLVHNGAVLSIVFLLVWQVGWKTKSYLTVRDSINGNNIYNYNLYIPYHSIFDPKVEIDREFTFFNYWQK